MGGCLKACRPGPAGCSTAWITHHPPLNRARPPATPPSRDRHENVIASSLRWQAAPRHWPFHRAEERADVRHRAQLPVPDPGPAGLRLAASRESRGLPGFRDPSHAGLSQHRRPDARGQQLAAQPADLRRAGGRHAARRAHRPGADPEVHVVGRAHRSARSRPVVPLRRLPRGRPSRPVAGARRRGRPLRDHAARARGGRHRHLVQPCRGQLASLLAAGGGARPGPARQAQRRPGAGAAHLAGERPSAGVRADARAGHARGFGRLSPDRHAVGDPGLRGLRQAAWQAGAGDRLRRAPHPALGRRAAAALAEPASGQPAEGPREPRAARSHAHHARQVHRDRCRERRSAAGSPADRLGQLHHRGHHRAGQRAGTASTRRSWPGSTTIARARWPPIPRSPTRRS